MDHGEHMEVANNIKSSLPMRGEGAKVLAACEACRKQRKRCTGTQPCQSCVRRGIECVFETLRKRRGPAGAGETDADRSIRIIVAASAGPVGGLPAYEDTRTRRYKTRGEEGEGAEDYDGTRSPRDSMWDHDQHKRSRTEEGPPAGSNPVGLPPLSLLRHIPSGSSMTYGGGGGGGGVGDMSVGNAWSTAHAHAWASTALANEMGYASMQARMMSLPLGHMMSGYGGEHMGPAGQFVMGPHGPMLIPIIIPSLPEPPIPRQGSFTRGSGGPVSGVLQGESVRDPGRFLPRLLSREEQSFASDAHGGPGPRLPPTPRSSAMPSRASSGHDLGAGPYAVAKSDLLGMLAVLCSDENTAPSGRGGASFALSAGASRSAPAAPREDVMEMSEEDREKGEEEFTPEGEGAEEEVEAWTEEMGIGGEIRAAVPHPAAAAQAMQA